MILRIYPGLFYYIFLEISSVEKKDKQWNK